MLQVEVGAGGRCERMSERRSTMGRSKLLRAVVLSAALAAGGCGLKGSLEPPPGAKAEAAAAAKDRAASTVPSGPTSAKTATADSGQGKPEGAALRPHRDFPLDGLLR